ncbi:MAG: DUF1292 domain-containing protein [Eggerthellaceae bacterium]|nr:DUF1292 domain-containing protein [Eggerthellaceae bacterium]
MAPEGGVRTGSAPNFCPPVEEGVVFTFSDENGDLVNLEFLGLVLIDEARSGFFFPVTDDAPATSSGEVVVLEVTDLDEEGQPDSFELVDDDAIAQTAWDAFKEATRDLYEFE